MRRSRSTFVYVLACLVLVPLFTSAQSFQGGVRGTLKDGQGVIPGVLILLINQATHATRETTTNDVGEYSFPAIDPTKYTLKVEVPGFRPYETRT